MILSMQSWRDRHGIVTERHEAVKVFSQDSVYDCQTKAINWILWEYFHYFIVIQSLCHIWLFVTTWTAACSPSLFPRVCSNSCPLSWWCHPMIWSSVIPFSSCSQSFPASGSLPMSWLFVSGGQSIGTSASALPMNIQGWLPLGLTDLISLLSKRF